MCVCVCVSQVPYFPLLIVFPFTVNFPTERILTHCHIHVSLLACLFLYLLIPVFCLSLLYVCIKVPCFPLLSPFPSFLFHFLSLTLFSSLPPSLFSLSLFPSLLSLSLPPSSHSLSLPPSFHHFYNFFFFSLSLFQVSGVASED